MSSSHATLSSRTCMCTYVLCMQQAYRSTQSRNPVSDIIRPDSGASTSISSSTSKGGRSTEDLLGPISSDPGLESEGESLPSPSIQDSSNAHFNFTDKDLLAAISEADLLTLSVLPPLDLCWDLLCDVETFRVWGSVGNLLGMRKPFGYGVVWEILLGRGSVGNMVWEGLPGCLLGMG